ncbi:MAG TPA: hypothetical protein VGQ57_18360 [Polyangiaceae bacterium]|jgi:hypothetical protein|nr:hypothetical protein [Polyangiaceae bacterium]
MALFLASRSSLGRVVVTVALLSLAGCGRLERECRAVSETANPFIAESERLRPRADATPEETVKAELATAARYERLAQNLGALKIESSELLPEVERYRALAEHSALALRAAADAFGRGDFEAARGKRIELDVAARGEGPLVRRINEICGTATLDASAR